MKLLLDANLSWRLIEPLSAHFPVVEHVNRINLISPATDQQIWEYARVNGSFIVTNDDDFLKILLLRGFPPKIVLLRTGNQSTEYLKELLIQYKEKIKALSDSPDHGLLEIYG